MQPSNSSNRSGDYTKRSSSRNPEDLALIKKRSSQVDKKAPPIGRRRSKI